MLVIFYTISNVKNTLILTVIFKLLFTFFSSLTKVYMVRNMKDIPSRGFILLNFICCYLSAKYIYN